MTSNPADSAAVSNNDNQVRPFVGSAVVAVGVGIYIAALLIVALGNRGQIRYTADSNDTIPIWQPWLPAVVGVVVIMLVPRGQTEPDYRSAPTERVRAEAFTLLTLAIGFTILLELLGPAEPRYIILKLALLVCAPIALFAATRRRARSAPGDISAALSGRSESAIEGGHRHSWRPLIPAAGWVITYLVLSTAHPDNSFDTDLPTLASLIAIGFVLNAVVEEFFYRKWLQTRWTNFLGGVWPAIILTSIVWASWHIAIQGSGNLVLDLANVIANQGITGLFLGFLWVRYQAMWPLLVIHGLMNANPVTLF